MVSISHLHGIWGNGGDDAHKLPEVQPESVIGDGVRMQVMIVLCSTISCEIVTLDGESSRRTEVHGMLEVDLTP